MLEAVVPYSTDAMDRFLGRKPEKYCSEKTARLMAMAAYQRALELSKGNEFAGEEVIGIGATCKLKAANEREDRKHEIHVAIQAACKTGTYTLELTADRTREEEEKIAALLIFNALARHYGVPEISLPDEIGARSRIGTCTGIGQDRRQDRREEIIEKFASVSEEVGSLLRQQSCSPDFSCKKPIYSRTAPSSSERILSTGFLTQNTMAAQLIQPLF